MYKTVWTVIEGNYKTNLTWYHFGKAPKFPTWYMEEGKIYEIEMVANFKLVFNLKTFIKCLTHCYIVK